MEYFICLIIGMIIGFIICAMIYTGEQESIIKYYNNMLKAQCLICPFRSEELRED